MSSEQKRPQRRALRPETESAVIGIREPIGCRLLRRTSPNYGLPNVPMTAPDATERDLTRQELELPSSAWLREPAWARALPRVPRAWVPQAWQPRLEPPSFSLPAWPWPSWRIFSAPLPWTFWQISLPTSSPFSPISSHVFFDDFLADFFFAVTSFFLLFLFFLLFFPFSHRGPPVAADPCPSSVQVVRFRAGPIDQFNPGREPPVAQSRSSIV